MVLKKKNAGSLGVIGMVLGLIIGGILLLYAFGVLGSAGTYNDYNWLHFENKTVNTEILTSNKGKHDAVGLNQMQSKLNQIVGTVKPKFISVTYNDLYIFSGAGYKGANVDGYGDLIYDYSGDRPTMDVVVDEELNGVDTPVLIGDNLLNGNNDNPALGGVGKWYFVFTDTEKNEAAINKLLDDLHGAKFKVIRDVYIWDDDNNTRSIPAVVIVPTYN